MEYAFHQGRALMEANPACDALLAFAVFDDCDADSIRRRNIHQPQVQALVVVSENGSARLDGVTLDHFAKRFPVIAKRLRIAKFSEIFVFASLSPTI